MLPAPQVWVLRLGHLLHQSMCLMPALSLHPVLTHKAFCGPFRRLVVPSLPQSVPTLCFTSHIYFFSRMLGFLLLTSGATGELGP